MPTRPPAVAKVPLIVVPVTSEFWIVPALLLLPTRPPRRTDCADVPLPLIVPPLRCEETTVPSFWPMSPPTLAPAAVALALPVALAPLIDAFAALKPTRPPTPPAPLTLPVVDEAVIV